MLKKIDLKNFGSFKDFTWPTGLIGPKRIQLEFKELNILYGRNYSGKTTLSRAFRAIETGILPEDYDNPEFTITSDEGVFGPESLANCPYEVRVFNTDFIGHNLGFLIDKNREIEPFAVLGETNTTVTESIKEITERLEGVAGSEGLRGKRDRLNTVSDEKKQAHAKLKASSDKKLTDKARDIKADPECADVNYAAPRLRTDLKVVRDEERQRVPVEKIHALRASLKEDDLEAVEVSLPDRLDPDSIFTKTNLLLERSVSASEPIQRLAADAALNKWASDGMESNKERTSCGFCGQEFPSDLWAELGKHFSQEVTTLQAELKAAIETIDVELKICQNATSLDVLEFLPNNRKQIAAHNTSLGTRLKTYSSSLKALKKFVKLRLADILNVKKPVVAQVATNEISKEIRDIEAIAVKNNRAIDSQEETRDKNRKELRLGLVANFWHDAKIADAEVDITQAQRDFEDALAEAKEARDLVENVEVKIRSLSGQLTDEAAAVTSVNQYLRNHFGCDSIRLEAETIGGGQDSPQYQFKIYRGDHVAHNLSEGESRLVAFCYFLARLEDTASQGKEIVVFIDDPISSLDGNHIFFMFSLIDSVVAKPMQKAMGTQSDCCF